MLKNILLPKYTEHAKNIFNCREWKIQKDLGEKLPAGFMCLSKVANDNLKIVLESEIFMANMTWS